jgi:nitrate reductase gamma subunit
VGNWAVFLDQALLVILPYLSVFTLLLVTIQRYRSQAFTYSSLSSQFLDNRHHFWALVPFHYGILGIIAVHLAAFLIPRSVLVWNGHPLRLYVLEFGALVCGLMTIVGLVAGMIRRWTTPKLRVVTSRMDWLIFYMLGIQIVTGLGTALFYPWGSSWFASSAAPYLWSLIKLNPDITYISAMPFLVKFHIVGAFLLIGVFPFTRLVHILVVPNPYLWRKPQVVRWWRKAHREGA